LAEEDVQLAWKLSIAGAEEVKERLAEVHEQFDRGELTVQQYGKELKAQDSTLRTLTNSTQFQTRAWLAQHPTINQLSRSMSGLNRVLSATTAAMTAINTASLLMRSDSSTTIGLQNQLAEAERNYNAALTPEEKEKAARAVSSLKDEMAEAKKTADDDFINHMFSLGIGIAQIGTTILATIPRFKDLVTTLGDIGGGLAAIGSAFGLIAPVLITGAALFGTIASVIGAIALAIYYALTPGDQFADMLKSIFPNSAAAIDAASAAIDDFFKNVLIGGGIAALTWLASNFVSGVTQVWDTVSGLFTSAGAAITEAFAVFWNGLQSVAQSVSKSIVSTVTDMVDGIISAVKSALEWLSKLPGDIASGIGNFFSGGSSSSGGGSSGGGGAVRGYAAGGTFTTSGPTLFMAGEGGVREQVNVQSVGRASTSSNAGGNTYLNIHMDGSVVAERDLEGLINRYGIRQARRRGWKAR
jgi:phage-related protein